MMTNNTSSATRTKRRWVMFGMAYLCIMSYTIIMQSVPPVLSLVMSDLNLSYTQGGLMMGFFTLPGIITSIPAGMIVDRYGHKSVGITAFALTIIGTALVASGNSILPLMLGRAISGIGSMTLLMLAPRIIAQWFAENEMGTAMGIYNTAMPIATVLSMTLLSLIGEMAGWRISIWVSAVLPAVTLIVFALLFRASPWKGEKVTVASEGFFRSIKLAGAPIWFNGVAFLLFNAAVISIFTFTPDFLTATGISITSAGLITSAIMWPTLIFCPLFGYLIDKVDRKKLMIALSSLVCTVLILLIPTSTDWMIGMMLLFGTIHSVIPVAIFALVPEIVHPKRLGLGFGIIATCQSIGIAIGPPIAGVARDVIGTYQASYTLIAVFALLIILAMFILRRS